MNLEAGPIELQSTSPTAPQQPAPIRGTQSFLATIAECWKRPSLLGLELLWRWAFGIPAAAVLGWEAYRILSSVSLAHTGIAQFSLIDTVTAAQILAATADVLLPPIRDVARWLLPTLAVAWALASGFGRSLVLRRYDPSLRFAPWRRGLRSAVPRRAWFSISYRRSRSPSPFSFSGRSSAGCSASRRC